MTLDEAYAAYGYPPPDDDMAPLWGADVRPTTSNVPEDIRSRHAIDAPFTPLQQWAATLEAGTCTRCGQTARRGDTTWWHVQTRTCPSDDTSMRARFRGE